MMGRVDLRGPDGPAIMTGYGVIGGIVFSKHSIRCWLEWTGIGNALGIRIARSQGKHT
ncbi:MAG: hypothetical protein U0795_17585 [Pirellulales bacterium]